MRITNGHGRVSEDGWDATGAGDRSDHASSHRGAAAKPSEAVQACHNGGDGSTRQLEADFHVLHHNLARIESFIARNHGRAAEVQVTLNSQRALFQSLHQVYRQRTGHDFDPRCAGDQRRARVPEWTPPNAQESRRDYTI